MNFRRIFFSFVVLVAVLYGLLSWKFYGSVVPPWKDKYGDTVSLSDWWKENIGSWWHEHFGSQADQGDGGQRYVVDEPSPKEPISTSISDSEPQKPRVFEVDEDVVRSWIGFTRFVPDVALDTPENDSWSVRGVNSAMEGFVALAMRDCPDRPFVEGTDQNFFPKNNVEFRHFNPAFLKWCEVQISALFKEPRFKEWTAGFFKKHYSRAALAYWNTYKAMEAFPEEKEKLRLEYLSATNNGESIWDLADRDVLDKYEFSKDLIHVNKNYRDKIVFFWLRRQTDGTAEQLFDLLTSILSQYDLAGGPPTDRASKTVMIPPPAPRSFLDRIFGR